MRRMVVCATLGAILGLAAGCGTQVDHAEKQRQELQENTTKADAGDASAMYWVAEAYRYGRGVPKDAAQAQIWYAKSAAAGSDSASSSLAWLLVEDNMGTLAPKCTAAFATPIPERKGKAPLPALLLWSRDESSVQQGSRASTRGAEAWKSDNNHTLAHRFSARSFAGLKSVVCLLERYVQVGAYDRSGSAAVRIDHDVRVIRWPEGTVLAARTFQGADPAAKREGQGGMKSWEHGAPPPKTDLELWLSQVFAP